MGNINNNAQAIHLCDQALSQRAYAVVLGTAWVGSGIRKIIVSRVHQSDVADALIEEELCVANISAYGVAIFKAEINGAFTSFLQLISIRRVQGKPDDV